MRAKPLSIDDRRALNLDAAIPLIIAHGRDVTTRQVAERAGVAEGTVFRAFGDKESLISAASTRHLDPAALLSLLGGIDPDLSLETKVAAVVALLRGHFELVFGMIASLGEFHHPREKPDRFAFTAVNATLFESNEDELNCSPQRVGQVVRFLAFSSALPPLNDGDPMTDTELTDMVLRGVAGTSARLEPTEGRHSNARHHALPGHLLRRRRLLRGPRGNERRMRPACGDLPPGRHLQRARGDEVRGTVADHPHHKRRTAGADARADDLHPARLGADSRDRRRDHGAATGHRAVLAARGERARAAHRPRRHHRADGAPVPPDAGAHRQREPGAAGAARRHPRHPRLRA